MKILLVVDQFDEGNNGTTMTAQRLAHTLVRHGHEVSVVSTGKAGKNKYIVDEIFMTPLVRHIIHGQGMVIARSDRQVLREAISQADIVHFIMPFFLSVAGVKIAEELGVPHTAAFHVQPENVTYNIHLQRFEWLNKGIYQLFRKTFFDRFTHIHCPSQFIADQLVKNGYKAKLHVISNGVDGDFIYRKKEKMKRFQGKFVILMTGRLAGEKRQDLLIDAVKKSRYSEDIQIVLAGKGPRKKPLLRQAKGLKNPLLIRFFNHKQMLNMIAMSDLYVHTADVEIEAISCIEAFSGGLVPVIADSQKSATPQFALCKESLFAAGDSTDLADKIDYWIEHEQRRKEMEYVYSEYGRQFSLDSCVYQMEEMFEEAINDAKR